MKNTSVAQIDLNALRHNLDVVRRLCPASRIMAMVKADAYGHGLLQATQSLATADGFAVARLKEALQLREAGIRQRILLLTTLLDQEDLSICSEMDIDVTVHDEASLACVASQARRKSLRVWLKLDTGMHRAGLDPSAFVEADKLLRRVSGIRELIHMTHFSDAGDLASGATQEQLSCFWRCRRSTSDAMVSVANSAALIANPETHLDWVRPGIMLYGENPFGRDHPVFVRAMMTLRAPVIAIRKIGAGESVGYNRRWTSVRGSRIGTIGIGYGDGYPRHACNGTPVLIRGHAVPLVGQVSMDSLTVDLTDLDDVAVGDEATLWGAELPAAIVAAHAGTISYQLFTSLQGRVDRQYISCAAT